MGASLIALLFVGTLAFGQGTLEKLPDSEPHQSTPSLHSPNSNQMAQVGEMEVLNGPISFHTGSYLAFGLLAKIRTNWQRALNEKGLVPTSDQKTLAVEFTILKDGSLDRMKLAESSGDPELDGTGLDAVAKSAPFMAIPDEFSAQYLKLRCHFYLNPGKRIPSVSRAVLGSRSADAAGTMPTAGEGALHGNKGATMPRVVYQTMAEFSDEARKAKVQGTVVLKVTVAASGDVADVKVMKGLGSGLDEKAIEAVRTWKFKPGTQDGSPVPSEITVEVNFHLSK